MSYTIHIGKSKDKSIKCEVNIDGPNPTFIPAAIAIGVGDKLKRWEKHLDSVYNKDQKLLRFLAFVHKQAKEHGSIALICNCKFKHLHALGIKNFLEKNRETLDMMLPYMFPESGYKAQDTIQPENSKIPEDLKQQFNMGKTTLASLPENDRKQILTLLKQRKAEEGKDYIVIDSLSKIKTDE